MDTISCHWSYLFEHDERKSLERGLIVTGVLSIVLGLWLNTSLLFTNLGLEKSYRNLVNFTMISCVRRVIPFIANLPVFKFIESAGEIDLTCCEFYAFLETFMAVFEIEALTHVCIERYVVAKYVTNGWPIQKCHYILYQGLCFFFASLYSFPPLFGIGRYGFDFSCASCTFDMMLPESWGRYFVVTIFILRSIKPAIVMKYFDVIHLLNVKPPYLFLEWLDQNEVEGADDFTENHMDMLVPIVSLETAHNSPWTELESVMLIWARTLQGKIICSKETDNQKKFTLNVILITLVNAFCWIPIAMIRASVILSQLLYSDPIVLRDTELYIKWALWIHWVAPALTAVALFLIDPRIRDKMLQLHSTNGDEDYNKSK